MIEKFENFKNKQFNTVNESESKEDVSFNETVRDIYNKISLLIQKEVNTTERLSYVSEMIHDVNGLIQFKQKNGFKAQVVKIKDFNIDLFDDENFDENDYDRWVYNTTRVLDNGLLKGDSVGKFYNLKSEFNRKEISAISYIQFKKRLTELVKKDVTIVWV